jgi:hypothetical protein
MAADERRAVLAGCRWPLLSMFPNAMPHTTLTRRTETVMTLDAFTRYSTHRATVSTVVGSGSQNVLRLLVSKDFAGV